MRKRLITMLVLAGLGVLLVRSFPDIRRYIAMRRMLLCVREPYAGGRDTATWRPGWRLAGSGDTRNGSTHA